MNFQEYEKTYFARYAELANVVKHILEHAISEQQLPAPQSIQARAKGLKSLKDRLEESGLLGSQTIENERRDLAGARLIFYTNTDVEQFEKSGTLFENFDIERDAIRIHHPTMENNERRYRAIHYVVRLKDDRSKLPEYARLAGLRCEIQVHTILNHAWSETSHDIAYKNKRRDGFGNNAMASIERRLNKIMDTYLLPAGYEFQRVQHDYQRLQQGKELFDQDILQAIDAAPDNNVRSELLTSLKEHVLPNYDDVRGIFRDVLSAVVLAGKAARTAPTPPVKTAYGSFQGNSPQRIMLRVAEILDYLKYLDIGATFDAVCELYRDENNDEAKKALIDLIERFARWDIAVWDEIGPYTQVALVQSASKISSPEDLERLEPVLLGIWQSVLSFEISGTSRKGNSVIFSRGAVPITKEVRATRELALNSLFSAFKRASSDRERRAVLGALSTATQRPSVDRPSNALEQLVYADGIKIAKMLTSEVNNLSYEIRETIENKYIYRYRQARSIAADNNDEKGCKALASEYVATVEILRDSINEDALYVHYKTLVGYESVFADEWEKEKRDYTATQSYREAQAKQLLNEITDETEDSWFAFIERCATTESNDLATFPVYGSFLANLSQTNPSRAYRLIQRDHPQLMNFLPALLRGMMSSDDKLHDTICGNLIAQGKHLSTLAFHWRRAKPKSPKLITSLLRRAIDLEDDAAVSHCLLCAIECTPDAQLPSANDFYRPAVTYLTKRKNTVWAFNSLMGAEQNTLFDAMSRRDAVLLLKALLVAPKVDYAVERILSKVARRHSTLVWNFFERRLRISQMETTDARYVPIPYDLHTLNTVLSSDAKAAAEAAWLWYKRAPDLFRFYGGHLLHTIFPKFGEDISISLESIAVSGGSKASDFVLSVMENYHGERETHALLKRIIQLHPQDKSKMSSIDISLSNTGVVHGAFGFVEAMRNKRDLVRPWLEDERSEIRSFAADYLASIELRIAGEQRRAESRDAMMKIDYPDADDSGTNTDAESSERNDDDPIEDDSIDDDPT